MYKPKNILITGGCGFIGSNFVNQMVKKYQSYNFVNIDAMYYCASLDNVTVSESSNYKFVKGNLQSYDLIYHVLVENNIDTIIHFAAQSHVDNSFNEPLTYTLDNIVGSHILLEASRNYGKIQRYIHVSTDEVYGESMIGNNEHKKTEESIMCPTNPYAASKAGAELITMSYYHSFKLPVIITRGNNVYGPNQYPEKLIPKFIKMLKEGKKLTIHGEGNALRNFIHVDDVVTAFDIILHDGVLGEIYNIGSEDHNELSVLEVAKILIKEVHDDNDHDKYLTYVKDREYNDKRYFISNDKLKQLNWTQTIDFNDGIRSLVKLTQ